MAHVFGASHMYRHRLLLPWPLDVSGHACALAAAYPGVRVRMGAWMGLCICACVVCLLVSCVVASARILHLYGFQSLGLVSCCDRESLSAVRLMHERELFAPVWRSRVRAGKIHMAV